mgnify:CR=1 FL=1
MSLTKWRFVFLLFPLLSFGQKDTIPETHSLLLDRFKVKAGVFVPARNVAVRADGSSPNEGIDFDETFGFADNETTFFLQLDWRFSRNKKWMVSGEYFSVNNANRATLSRDIEFEDVIFEEGSFVRAGVEFALYRVFFSYAFITKPKHLLGAGLGSHLFQVGAFIEGEVRTNQGNLEFERRRVSAFLPLPNIGGYYYYKPHERWVLGGRVDWFGITVDEYSGGLWNIAPNVSFQILRNFGVALDYRLFFLNAKVSQENWNGRFEMDFSGPLFTLYGNF